MKNDYPYNRLQTVKLSRFKRLMYFHFTIGFLLLCSMFFTKAPYASAFGEDADPTNAPGFPNEPTGITWNSGRELEPEDDYAWFSSTNADTTAVRTCFIHRGAGIGGDIGMVFNDAYHMAVLLGNMYCWSGSSWSFMGGIGGAGDSLWKVTQGDLERTVLINADLYNRVQSYNYGSYYNVGGTNVNTKADGALIMEANIASGTFVSDPTSPVIFGQRITFTVSWENFEAAPEWFYFYPMGRDAGNCTANCPDYIPIVEGVPVGENGTGSVTFDYTYYLAGVYEPTIIFSEDCAIFDINVAYSECNATRKTITLTVNGPTDGDDEADILLEFTSTGTDRVIGEPQPYEWRVDSSYQCPDSTIETKRLYGGYPGSADDLDNGVELTGTSGSGNYTFIHTSEELGSNFTPYIYVVCADGNTSTIFLENTLYRGRSRSLIVVGEEFSEIPYTSTPWTGGGKSIDFDSSTGSGAYFYTNKTSYMRDEPVLLRYYFQVGFTPSVVKIYRDINQYPTGVFTLTGAYVTNSTEHNYKFYYTAQGKYYPMIEVRSASYDANDPSTYRRIWFGGGQSKDVSKYLTITNELFGNTTWGGTPDTSWFNNTDGIFGLSPATFNISFGNSTNPLLQGLSEILGKVIQAGLYILQYAYGILKNAPIFSFLADVIHPVNGSKIYFPGGLFGYTFTVAPTTPYQTIQYAPTDSGFKLFEYLINAFLFVAVFRKVFKTFVH